MIHKITSRCFELTLELWWDGKIARSPFPSETYQRKWKRYWFSAHSFFIISHSEILFSKHARKAVFVSGTYGWWVEWIVKLVIEEKGNVWADDKRGEFFRMHFVTPHQHRNSNECHEKASVLFLIFNRSEKKRTIIITFNSFLLMSFKNSYCK